MESAADISNLSAIPDGAAPRKKLPLLIVIGLGLLVGVAVGVFVAGPMVAKKLRGAPAADHAVAKGDHAKDAKGASSKVLRVIDNLVLNPAGSGGTRYLMLTATFEVKDAAADEMLKERDAEVRDVLLSRLSRKTVEELTDMGGRDALKAEMLGMLAPMFPAGTVKQVFFPQFVIQ
jgi:flagellar FliL protein